MLQLLSGMPFNEQHEISRFHWYAFELHPLFTPMAYMWRNKRGSTNPSKAQRLTEISFPQHHIPEPYTQLQAQTDLTRFEFHKCFWIVLKYFKTCCLSMNHQNYTTTCETLHGNPSVQRRKVLVCSLRNLSMSPVTAQPMTTSLQPTVIWFSSI